MKRHHLFAAAAAVTLAASSLAFAEAQAAKDYVKQAQDLAANNDNDGATAKLDLAEAELDGVDPATKDSIAASIKAVRATIGKAAASAHADEYHRKLGQAMDEAEGAIGNAVTWPGAASAVKEIFDNADAQAAVPDEIAAAKKKFATFEKLSNKKLAVIMAAQAQDALKQLDNKWAEEKPKFADPSGGDKDTAITDMTHAIEDTKRQIAVLPPGSDELKAANDHVDKIGAEFTSIALAGKAKEVTARLKDSFASYHDEYDGWDKETGPGPSWADFKSNQNDTIEAFNAPKSKGLISRTNGFLKDLDTNDDYKEVASAAEMKAFIDGIKSDRDKAYAHMLSSVKPVVDGALAEGGEKLSGLKDDIRLALGEESPEGKAIQDSLQKRIDGATAAAAGADAEKQAWYKKMTDAVAAAWPDISAKFPPEEGFDPNDPASFKGKIVKITTDNLMGLRFKPGDFEFATTLNGLPIACHFDPALKAAIAAVEAKLGRHLQDSDDDGKWTIYAVVTGAKGRLMQSKQAEGDVKVDGEKVGTVTTDYADPVDAPILTIVAAKCGPFAGGKDAGIIQCDGTMAK